ncbi:MAG: hypothetical protein IJV26_01830 [Lachnospiraceae bacterium]|nr:hypothetical protein [Lachnospiraceae bacterium]
MEQIIHTPQDLTYLSWSKIRNSSGTAGSFLKSQEDIGGKKRFYKLSDYTPFYGVIGHESVNEIIADRLLTVLDIPHIPYQLIHADIVIDHKQIRTWLCASDDFRERGEKKAALDDYYLANRQENESPLDFCIRSGWTEYIYQMLITDYLILNRDRHGANIEVLINPHRKTVRLAPLFDHGVSFFCRTSEDDLEKEDVMADKKVQCFVGSHSALDNLHLIPAGQYPRLNSLKESDRSFILEGLEDVLSRRRLDYTWEMIWRRWQVYENLRNQR